MRIAMITGEYPPLEGGVGDFTRRLSQALLSQGHEIHVLTSGPGSPAQKEKPGLHIHRRMGSWRWGDQRQIVAWLHEIEADLINLQYQAAAYEMRGSVPLFPWRQRRHLPGPLVTTFHDLRTPYLFPKAGPLRPWVIWQLARHSDGVILTNDADYTRLTEAIAEEQRPPVRLIPIGSNIEPVDATGYEGAAYRRQAGIPEDALLLGFFGFLNASKGVETLLHALARLVEQGLPAHLLFVGGRTGSSDATNAAYADGIDALIAELGLGTRVHQTGFVTPEGVSEALLATDLCVLPYRDGASLRRGTLHACLAHGRPIVTTHPESPDTALVDGENALLVAPADVAATVEAVRRLHQTPALRTRLEENARALAQQFSWERIAARTARFFESLTGG